MDSADFNYSVDALRSSTKVSKSGCLLKFIFFGAKGEKYEVNLCDSYNHIDLYSEISATSAKRLFAGSGDCPKPLFGIDFYIGDDDAKQFTATKKRVLELFGNVLKVYGSKYKEVDLNKLTSSSLTDPNTKLACANYLMDQYLNRCSAFEGKQNSEVPVNLDKPKK